MNTKEPTTGPLTSVMDIVTDSLSLMKLLNLRINDLSKHITYLYIFNAVVILTFIGILASS